MAQPEIYDLLGIPSENEARTRSVLGSPAPSSYGSYYRGFEARRAPSMGFNSPQRVLSMRDYQQAQARANYEQEARRAIQGLATIQPDDPEFPYKQEQILYRSPYGRELVKDPRVTGLIKTRTAESMRLQKQFQADPESQTDYILARREGLDPQTALGRAMQASELRKNRLWFTEKGGNLEDFDSGRFIQNGRFDQAAAQSYINQLTKSQKEESKNKPWQERLSFKEGEAIRETARAARDLADFEEEFAAVQKDNPALTRDAYVKQFKNAPDFNAYKINRLMSTGDQLMREYGMSREEAANVLGIPLQASEASPVTGPAPEGRKGPEAMFEGVRGEPSTIAPVFEGQKETGLPRSETGGSMEATGAPVSQADLKKVEPVSFENLQRQMLAEREAKAAEKADTQKRRAEEEQRSIDINVPKWEGAKQELLQQFRPEFLRFGSDGEIRTMLSSMGKTWNDRAFDDARGEPVSWLEVGRALLSDDRIKAIRDGKGTLPSSTPISTPQQQSLPKVETAEQFSAIPSGSWFVDSSGVPKRKK